ncbi:MAG: acyl carrier protein [Candidatus Omnitrophica bacterium]|nr:acyl carrier protein [Candidatus Omnitrophota bacterium]MBU4467663.1 acyl carrier protein [Candidatus Omnitrophota bacterium]MCG2707487.1 acyl carrier protein [Candidatus Omnitrophota bacterium]
MSLEERVIKTIEENLEKKEKVGLNTDLRNDLGLDSFARVIIINALEDEFGITIPDYEFKNINTVAEIVKGLREHFPDLKES